MTLQQKLLWERLTKEVREAGMDNLHARELYEEISKLIDMSDKVLLSITEKDQGLEVRLGEQAYGNLAVVGLLEKIKLTILESEPSGEEILASKKYDA
jgi:hypothetical protein